jgi:hypothetical protein
LVGRARMFALVVPLLALAVVAGACSSDDGGDGGTVEITLQEFAIAANPATVSAGSVTFDATNTGPDDPHELVVFRTDLAPDALPTNDNGAVNEEGEGIELIGEIEEFPVGETDSASFDLDAGNYVLVCNIWDEDEQEAHYAEGMRLAFTVE